MKLHCPHCGVKGSAEDSYSGRKVKCPKCQGVFKVKPDMAVEPPEDAALLSALSSTPTESPDLAGKVAMPIAAGKGFGKTGVDEVLSVEEDEQPGESDGDPTEPEPETTPPAEQEETLDWEDIASEIDLPLAEGEMGEEHEETLNGDPAQLSSFLDEFEKPAGDFNLTEESSLADPVDSGSPEQEIENDLSESVEIAESDDEGIPEDEVQLVQEADEIELEPYGIDKEQCWQCGKIDSIGESFIAKDGRLYCTDCIPIEDPEETAGTNQQQDAADTFYAQGLNVGDTGSTDEATDRSYNTFTVGNAIRKVWAKAGVVYQHLFGDDKKR
jgi:hypothetical protein